MKKLRVVRYQVQPELVVDEDGLLTPIGVQPMIVTAAEWPHFAAEGLKAMIAEAESKLNKSTAPKPLLPTVPAKNGARTKAKVK